MGCHPSEQVGPDRGKDQTGTLAQNSVTSVVSVFFPFGTSHLSGTLRHTDPAGPACDPYSTPHWRHRGGHLLGLEQVNDPKSLGSLSDLRLLRVNILFLALVYSYDFYRLVLMSFLFNFISFLLSPGRKDS